jgi:hypothetical protein
MCMDSTNLLLITCTSNTDYTGGDLCLSYRSENRYDYYYSYTEGYVTEDGSY